MTYKLRDYQQAAIDATWSYLCNQTGHPVIVVPTGGGKSLLCAELARGATDNGLRVMVLAHRKELLEQNAEKIRALLPNVSVGIYSAGLRSKDTADDVIVAGIQSVYKRAFDFDARHLIIVDEAHLIPNSGSGMYRQFLDDMAISNPKHRVVGLTATPYRLDCGLICGPDELFDSFSYEVQIGKLIEDGFLSPVVNRPVNEVDTSELHHRGGEFINAEVESLFESHVVDACQETVAVAAFDHRKHCLIFCSGVQHASHVAELIEQMSGEPVGVITGDSLPLERAAILDAFKHGRLRWLINVDVLTTGFDAPCIDLIAIMRATESPALLAQMLGRGFRIAPGKTDFLVLDFGGNLRRLGQVDDPNFGKIKPKSSGGEPGDAPQKVCPACNKDVFAGSKSCEYCGFEFPPSETKHDPTADKHSAVLMSQVKPERWTVLEVTSSVHTKRGASEDDPKTFRVNYHCQPFGEDTNGNLTGETISEWVCVEHEGFARRKAMKWWQERTEIECPHTAEEAVEIQRGQGLADTIEITTKREGKYRRIVSAVLGEKPDYWEESESDTWEEVEAPF
jgi:DNA repair protein RadD